LYLGHNLACTTDAVRQVIVPRGAFRLLSGSDRLFARKAQKLPCWSRISLAIVRVNMTNARSGTLWVDKYRPTSLQTLRYNKDIGERIGRLCATGDIPHLLLYGPSGAGKRTLAACALRELYGPSVEKRKVSHRAYKIGDPPRDVELTAISSVHHVEVNPADAGTNDRLIVQQIIKDMAATAPIDFSGKASAGAGDDAENVGANGRASGKRRTPTFKTIVLHEVDQMSRLAQQALRRTMEKYARTCRIIMIAESSTKVLEPLRSRCLGIRVPLPSPSALGDVLSHVADLEGIEVPGAVMSRIVQQPDINTRRAILQLEAIVVCHGAVNINPAAVVELSDWEVACREIAVKLTQRQSVDQLVVVRKLLQVLLAHAVPQDVVLRRVVVEILSIVDDEIAPSICGAAAKFDARMAKGSKPIFHLEAFAARFMQIYASYLAGLMAD
jgi:replication factor C subunit 3/5